MGCLLICVKINVAGIFYITKYKMEVTFGGGRNLASYELKDSKWNKFSYLNFSMLWNYPGTNWTLVL